MNITNFEIKTEIFLNLYKKNQQKSNIRKKNIVFSKKMLILLE
jgi:DNA-binding CsgD family transcriptional regulator